MRRSSILGREVEPELLAVAEEGATATDSAEVRVVDLRESDPQGPRPEEILALQFEYYNMTDYERVYDLYAQEGKDRVSEQVFVSIQKATKQQGDKSTIPSYSFPSVEIEGDRATIQVVTNSDAEGEGELSAYREPAVLEGEGWRIVMHPDLYIIAECWVEMRRLC